MNFHLLDAGGAGLAYFIFALFAGFIVLAMLIEAAVMYYRKYNTRFGKALLDSFVINLVSTAAGFILIEYVSDFFNSGYWLNLLVLYAITVVIEWGVLQLLNRAQSPKRTLTVCLLMNIITYILLFLFFIGR